MYVVRRAFRNHGQMITPGSVVEPGNVKRFKSRLNDRYIIEVNEHNFEKWDEYFRVRMNVTIPPIKTDEVKTDDVKTDDVKTDDVKTDDVKTDDVKTDDVKTDDVKTDEVIKATPVVKVVSK